MWIHLPSSCWFAFGQWEALAGDQRAGVEKGQGIYPTGSFFPGYSLRCLKFWHLLAFSHYISAIASAVLSKNLFKLSLWFLCKTLFPLTCSANCSSASRRLLSLFKLSVRVSILSGRTSMFCTLSQEKWKTPLVELPLLLVTVSSPPSLCPGPTTLCKVVTWPIMKVSLGVIL